MSNTVTYELFNTAAIRSRCGNILTAALADRSAHWRVDLTRLPECAREVAALTRSRFPDLKIPYHSRWRHFEAGGVDRYASWRQQMASASVAERARSEIDLAVVSVLLDAGAGAQWHYKERTTTTERPLTTERIATAQKTANIEQSFSRSEGLGLASWYLFLSGAFSSDITQPWRADANGLIAITERTIERGFQVDATNPLIGVAGRALLLNRLGAVIAKDPQRFGTPARPGGLFDRLTEHGAKKTIRAQDLLREVLVGLASIWPSENRIDGHAVGDCWPHRLAGGSGATQGWVPIHKLSQWLTYSLLEPFERAGITVSGLDELTALAEYRNGGLLIDAGVIVARDPALLTQALSARDEAVIEWRALTVSLLDRLADEVRRELSCTASQLPLARILEGGTWATGRLLAQQRRDGLPPLNIVSDGTVF